MGLLGDFALGLAKTALNSLLDDENPKESNSEPIGITFETNFPFAFLNMRNLVLENLIRGSRTLLSEKLSNENSEYTQGAYYLCNKDTGIDGRDVVEYISAFVVTNGDTTVWYGTCGGMGQPALYIIGSESKSVADSLKETLEKLQCCNIQFYNGELPFSNKSWLFKATESLKNKIEGEQREYLEYAKNEAFIKCISFVLSRKKEILPEEIAILEEEFPNIEEKLHEEEKIIQNTRRISDYFDFQHNLTIEGKKEVAVAVIVVIWNLICQKINANEKALPNYTYNFILMKKYIHLDDNNFLSALQEANISAEELSVIKRLLSNNEIDYIRDNFPDICDSDDLEEAKKRREQAKVDLMRKQVADLFEKNALNNDIDGWLKENVIVYVNKHKEEVERSKTSFGISISNDLKENILMLYNADAFKPFASGFILTDKKLYTKEPMEEMHCWNLEDVNISLSKGLIFCKLKVNGVVVDANLVKKYLKQAGLLIEVVNTVISTILQNDSKV